MNNVANGFGRFSDDNLEYIITAPFAPPRFQVNFMWNDSIVSGVNQFGTGEGVFNDQTMLVNCPEGRVRMIREGRRYFYLRDNDTGEYWTAGLFPKTVPGASLRTRVGLGYSVFESEACGIKCTSTVMLAPDEPVEMWSFTLTNLSPEKRNLSLIPYVEWMLGGYSTFSSPYSYLRSAVDPERNAVLSFNTSDERPHSRYNAFLAASVPFEQWCGGRRDFLGPFGTITEPEALKAGRMSCRESWCEELAGSMMLDCELNPEESKEIAVLLGSFDTEAEKDRLIDKCMEPGYREEAFISLQADKQEMINKVEIVTPDDRINRLVNIWTKHQIQLCTEFGRDGARGFRDTLQDAWGILPFNASLAKEKILETISHQHSDGHAIRGWMPIQAHQYSDGPTWIAPTVIAYLKETGETEFLSETAPFLDGGEASVLEHLLRGIRHLSEDLGSHGLVLAREGDWNDSLNWMGRGGKGESVWTSMALYHSLILTIELAETVLRDPTLAAELQERAARIQSAIDTHGWDGEWYLAGYSDEGRKVGSQENAEGQIFLNTQTWGIMTGLATGERYDKCLKAVDDILESEHGSLTLFPTYTQEDKHVGRVTVLLPGMYENGTPYCHGTAFKIAADCCANRPDIALRSFYKVMPDSPDHPSSVSGCEPYAFTNQYLGPENGRSGDSISGWISGTAGWMFRVVLEYFLGVQPGYHGLHLRPSLPAGWKDVSVTRTLRGKSYRINYRCDSSGRPQIWVNDQLCENGFIPYG